MSIADQALEEAKRGTKVALVVLNMNRAEDLSRAWRARNTDVKLFSKGRAHDVKVGKGRSAGSVHFISASTSDAVERIAGLRAMYFIEPEAIDALSPLAMGAIRAADAKRK